MTDPSGVTTTYSHYAGGLVREQQGPHPAERWTYSYDGFGQVREKRLSGPAGGGAGWVGATWEYRYGADGTLSH